VSVLSSLISSLEDKTADLCWKYSEVGRPAGSSNLVGDGGNGGNGGTSRAIEGVVDVWVVAGMLSGAREDFV
jgi:hypothetical protein